MTQQEKQQAIDAQQSLILDREGRLKQTDYIAAKIAEGKATKTEYKAEIEQRQQWRDDINVAQAEISRLQAIQAEESEPADDTVSDDTETEPQQPASGGSSSEQGDNEG